MEDQKTTGSLEKFNKIADEQEAKLKWYTEYRDEVPKEFVPKNLLARSTGPFHVMHTGKESIHRVEFINWKAYWICNVEIDGVWHTASFPNSTNMIEFLAEGQINRAKMWPIGRNYTAL